jgi:GNAT superfamily N-acetyltransferase
MVALRLATTEDFENLMALSEELAAFNIQLGQRRPLRWRNGRQDYFRPFVSGALRDPSTHRIVVAEADGRVIGTCHTALKGDSEPCAAHVHTLIVAEAWRGRGIGRRLLDDAFEWCDRVGADEVSLNVAWPAVETRRFYERYGFEAVNTLYVKTSD